MMKFKEWIAEANATMPKMAAPTANPATIASIAAKNKAFTFFSDMPRTGTFSDTWG